MDTFWSPEFFAWEFPFRFPAEGGKSFFRQETTEKVLGIYFLIPGLFPLRDKSFNPALHGLIFICTGKNPKG